MPTETLFEKGNYASVSSGKCQRQMLLDQPGLQRLGSMYGSYRVIGNIFIQRWGKSPDKFLAWLMPDYLSAGIISLDYRTAGVRLAMPYV